MNKELIFVSKIENMLTIVATTALILGLAAIFKSWHCLWGLVLLLNINSVRFRSETKS